MSVEFDSWYKLMIEFANGRLLTKIRELESEGNPFSEDFAKEFCYTILMVRDGRKRSECDGLSPDDVWKLTE